MRADPGDQRVVLDLAEVDAEVNRLRYRSANLPENAELDELREQESTHRDDQVRAEIAAEDLQREISRLENDVATLRLRETKDTERLTSGALPAKALSELQHELSSLERRRGVVEDELLELLEQQEAVEAEQQRVAATLSHLAERIADVEQRRLIALGDVEEQLTSRQRHRDELEASTQPELLTVYRSQHDRGRIGAGLLRARTCGACRMELDRGTIARIAKAPADEVVRCDECGAILVRTAESGL
ncbi:zinc ribbon domain-containing protein [Williamsia sterculiae]|uniref:Uncharacterized protein n=1 Tax=Williamsia sterculiae TaxID=1344003 RepID=A0A1N7G9J0_9NOCA|nr:C4-type zinc ribbon domain-containing protein [Williamsia sterculiae]SIS09156.1 hypothetical protein SAMN05445060_2621 [Williamsia sterculiae]